MRFNHLIVEIQDKIAWISINRPKKLNALNREVLEELNTLFVALNNDAAVRIIILTGSGDKAFIAGADIAEFAAFDALEGEALSRKGQQTVFDQIAETNKPVIAAINGFALGGGLELALSCHVRISHSWRLAQRNYFPMPLGVHVKMKIQTPIDPKVYTQEEALVLLEKTVKKEIKN